MRAWKLFILNLLQWFRCFFNIYRLSSDCPSRQDLTKTRVNCRKSLVMSVETRVGDTGGRNVKGCYWLSVNANRKCWFKIFHRLIFQMFSIGCVFTLAPSINRFFLKKSEYHAFKLYILLENMLLLYCWHVPTLNGYSLTVHLTKIINVDWNQKSPLLNWMKVRFSAAFYSHICNFVVV